MKAVIMAGGEGTRLRPLTSTQPKPMLPMANIPMMEHIVRLLAQHGFDEIVVTVAYLANAIRTYFGDGAEFGVKISYVSEDSPLGTAGSVGNARELLDERFLVISGDVLTDTDLTAVWEYHQSEGAMVTIVLQRVENPLEFGIVTTGSEGQILRFLEKPTWGEVFTDTVNTGIYVLEPEIFEYIAKGTPVDFSADVFPKLLDEEKRMFGYISDHYWEDVGTIQGYLKAHRDILDRKVDVYVPGFALRSGVILGEGADIHPSAKIEEPVLIGANSRIGPRTRLKAYAVIGPDCKIGEDATIDNSVISEHCFVGSTTQVRGTVIGRSCDLRKGVMVEDGAVIGDDCYIGDQAIIQPFVKIYPSKTVQSRTTVNTSIVWESRASRTLFDSVGVTGLANVDITPEMAVRVGMAFGSILPPGSRLVASRDTSRSARMIKRAVMVGMNAVGITISDLEVASMPLARYHCRYTDASGGFRVSLDPTDSQVIEIRFLGSRGEDLSEGARRKIERGMQREDFRKVLASEVGDLAFPGRVVEFFVQSLIEQVDLDTIKERGFRIVADYSFGTIGALIHNLFGKLGADVLSINPYGATARSIQLNSSEQIQRVKRLVVESGADLGVVFDRSGENFDLIDDVGHLLEGQNFVLTLARVLAGKSFKELILPVDASIEVAVAAESLGYEIQWVKRGLSGISTAVFSPENIRGDVTDRIGLSPDGFIAASGVVYGPDCVYNLAMVLEALARKSQKLSDLSSPRTNHVVLSEAVHTPFELKGSVMRYVLEQEGRQNVLLVDGVRFSDSDGGYTLIAPDAVEPLTSVIVEAPTLDLAEEKLEKVARFLEGIIHSA